MEEEKDAFYVVRKGDVIGIYKTQHDCQAQAGFSVCNPSVTVFKGYGLPKETEEYLASHGLKNSIYYASAGDIKEDLFGKLVPCSFQGSMLCHNSSFMFIRTDSLKQLRSLTLEFGG